MIFSETELETVKETMNSLGNYLPENKMHVIWTWYLQITGTNEPKPCNCQSAAGLWVKAVNTINEYIKQ
jgi:hypothetical protein